MRKSRRDLELTISDLRAQGERAARQRDQVQHKLDSSRVENQTMKVAVLAVALMIENKAECGAVETGSDIAAYQSLMQRAGDLRRSVESEPWLSEQAVALYEELTS